MAKKKMNKKAHIRNRKRQPKKVVRSKEQYDLPLDPDKIKAILAYSR